MKHARVIHEGRVQRATERDGQLLLADGRLEQIYRRYGLWNDLQHTLVDLGGKSDEQLGIHAERIGGWAVIRSRGMLLVEADTRTVADRRRLSFAGAISVAIAMSDKGELIEDPSLDLIGIPERDGDGGLMHEVVHDAVLETIESLPRGRRRDPDAVAEAVRRGVRAAVAQRWGKKPMCHIHVLTV